MIEEIITRLTNDSNSIDIREDYTNNDGVECIMLIIGQKDFENGGADGEDILLTKIEVENLIEKLQSIVGKYKYLGSFTFSVDISLR